MQLSILTPQQRIATIISILLIPPTISFVTFSLLAALFEQGTAFHTFSVAFVSVSFSGILPMLYVLYLRKQRMVTGYDVPIREQRTNPYIITVLYSALGFFLLLFMHSSVYVWSLMWCYSINTFILLLINKKWKISAHMMGLTGPLVMLSIIFNWYVFLAFPVILLLGWARVVLKVHTLAQVVAGACTGAILTVLQLYLIFRFGIDWIKLINI
jgi:membrane-associated phospholipid phosphatase